MIASPSRCPRSWFGKSTATSAIGASSFCARSRASWTGAGGTSFAARCGSPTWRAKRSPRPASASGWPVYLTETGTWLTWRRARPFAGSLDRAGSSNSVRDRRRATRGVLTGYGRLGNSVAWHAVGGVAYSVFVAIVARYVTGLRLCRDTGRAVVPPSKRQWHRAAGQVRQGAQEATARDPRALPLAFAQQRDHPPPATLYQKKH